MSEMLDRVASAVAGTKLGRAVGYQHIALLAMEAARAAITAMREPTGEMCGAGQSEGAANVRSWTIGQHSVAEFRIGAEQKVWVAMIDAALSEGDA